MTNYIVKIQPSASRRFFSIFILCLSAGVMIYFAITDPAQSIVLKLILLSLAGIFLWQVQANLRFPNAALLLKRDGLYDDQCEIICSLSNIALVDRGWFSIKPSNGFLLRLHEKASIKWLPGVYWRIGKRMGVGGAINPTQTKEFSDKLLLLQQEIVTGVELL